MYQKILAPLDGSELGECTLAHVKAIAQGCGTHEVILLRALEPISETGFWEVPDLLRETQAKRQANAEEYLAKVAASLNKEGLTTRTAVVSGSAAGEILDYASKNKVDLIIISTHGRSGPSRWAFGSVTDKVVRHSTVPVLTISAGGCRIR